MSENQTLTDEQKEIMEAIKKEFPGMEWELKDSRENDEIKSDLKEAQ